MTRTKSTLSKEQSICLSVHIYTYLVFGLVYFAYMPQLCCKPVVLTYILFSREKGSLSIYQGICENNKCFYLEN